MEYRSFSFIGNVSVCSSNVLPHKVNEFCRFITYKLDASRFRWVQRKIGNTPRDSYAMRIWIAVNELPIGTEEFMHPQFNLKFLKISRQNARLAMRMNL